MKPPISLLDLACAWFWSCVLTLLCRAVGRNNFYFARVVAVACTLAAGVLFGWLAYGWEVSVIGAVSFGVLVLAVVCHVVLVVHSADHLEDALRAGDHYRRPSRLLAWVQYVRLFEMAAATLLLIGGLWIPAILTALLASSLYFLFDFRLPAK